tara:strand:- start:1912 stop:2865 length:954 start_codon:yes stop_codon:yes gene_type:complete
MSKYAHPDDIKNISIIGGGVIGASWSSFFSLQGMEVKVCETNADKRSTFFRRISKTKKLIENSNLRISRKSGQISIYNTIEDTVLDTHFVQESAPDNKEIKLSVFKELDKKVPPHVPIASSTSSLLITPLQKHCKTASRFFTGHPYNPVNIIPLVEISGGDQTDEKILEWAMSFYTSLGKYPVKLNKEIIGHIAGRLNAALWQEAVHLVSEGIADVETIDAAIINGPGLRSAVMGPHLTYHLAGGEGGIRHYISHLGKSQEQRWQLLGKPKLDSSTCKKLIDGIEEESKDKTIDDLETERDLALIKILKSRQIKTKK